MTWLAWLGVVGAEVWLAREIFAPRVRYDHALLACALLVLTLSLATSVELVQAWRERESP